MIGSRSCLWIALFVSVSVLSASAADSFWTASLDNGAEIDVTFGRLHDMPIPRLPCEGILQCWLDDIQLTLRLPIAVSGIKVDLNLTFYGIRLNNITSSGGDYDTSLSFELAGVSTRGYGPYAFSLLGVDGEGTANINVTNSNISMTVAFDSTDTLPALPSALRVPLCRAQIDVSIFLNGTDASAVDKLIEQYKEKIDSEMGRLICTELRQLLAVNGTKALQTLDAVLLPMLSNYTPTYPPDVPPPPQYGQRLLSWKSSLLQPLDSLLNNPKHGFLAHPSCFMPRLVGESAISFEVNKNVSLDLNFTKLVIHLGQLQLGGLDTIDKLLLLHPVDYQNQTLSTDIGADRLDISLQMTIYVALEEGVVTDTDGMLKESVTLDLSLRDLKLLADFMIAIEADRFDNLTVADLLAFTDPSQNLALILQCLVPSFAFMNTTAGELNVGLSQLLLLPVGAAGGTLELFLDGMINRLIGLVVDNYGEAFTVLLRNMARPPGKLAGLWAFADGLFQTFNELPYNCQDVPVSNSTDPIHWNETLLVPVSALISSIPPQDIDVLMQCAGLDPGWHPSDPTAMAPMESSANAPLRSVRSVATYSVHDIARLFRLESSHLRTPVPLMRGSSVPSARRAAVLMDVGDTPSDTKISVDVSVTGVASLWELIVLRPNGAFLLDNRIGIGSSNTSDPQVPLNVSVFLDIAFEAIHTTLAVNVSLSQLELLLGLDLDMNLHAVEKLRLNEMLEPGCLAASMDSFGLDGLALTMGGIDTRIGFHGGGGKIDQTFVLGGSNFTATCNMAIAELMPFLQKLSNQNLDKMVADSHYVCAGLPIPTAPGTAHNPWYTQVALLVAACVVILIVFVLAHRWLGTKLNDCPCVGCCSKKELADDDEADSMYAPVRGGLNQHTPSDIDEARAEAKSWRHSLICSSKIPLYMRIVVLLLILTNIGLFISSNLSVGASVGVTISVGDTQVSLGDLFAFSLANSVRDMWNAGVYPLALLIAIFSGAWPYLKLILMFMAWVFPLRVLPQTRRETMLIWLDRLGKWSLIDTYVMVMFMVAFHFHIAVDDQLIIVDVIVYPQYGIFSFILATMLSLALSHILLAYHRHEISESVVPAGGMKEALRAHSHRIKTTVHNGDALLNARRGRVKCTACGQAIVTMFVLFACVFFAAGVYYNVFSFDFKGLAGWALGAQADSEYSLVSLGLFLPSSSTNPNSFSIRWMQLVYFTFALGMPALYLLVLLVLWLVPMTLQTQRMLLVLSEVTYAWSALEVFIISILASVQEISQFTGFIIGDKCDLINQLLAALFNGPLHGDDKCFDLIATMGRGGWILIGAAVIFQLCGALLGNISEAAVTDRIKDYNKISKRRRASAPERSVRHARAGQYVDSQHADDLMLPHDEEYESSDTDEEPTAAPPKRDKSYGSLSNSASMSPFTGDDVSEFTAVDEDECCFACARRCKNCEINFHMNVYRFMESCGMVTLKFNTSQRSSSQVL